MSNYNGHLNGGLVGAGAFCVTSVYLGNPAPVTVLGAVSVVIFALFPDVDIKSKFSKFFYWCVFVAMAYLYFIANLQQIAFMLGFLSITPQLVNHRGIFHSKYFAVLIPAYVYYFYYISIINLADAILLHVAGMVGYFIHLLLDVNYGKFFRWQKKSR